MTTQTPLTYPLTDADRALLDRVPKGLYLSLIHI